MPELDHVAILVKSVESARERCAGLGATLGEIEDFQGEGTRECYVGQAGTAGRLLLLEAIGDGPYRRALEKRGPGLHHVALSVRALEPYLTSLAGTGWYLPVQSLGTIAECRTAWLARPGMALLVEVMEVDDPAPAPESLVTTVALPACPDRTLLVAALDAAAVVSAPDGPYLVISGERLRVDHWLS